MCSLKISLRSSIRLIWCMGVASGISNPSRGILCPSATLPQSLILTQSRRTGTASKPTLASKLLARRLVDKLSRRNTGRDSCLEPPPLHTPLYSTEICLLTRACKADDAQIKMPSFNVVEKSSFLPALQRRSKAWNRCRSLPQ